MKRKFKSIVALIAAAIMVFSVVGTVSADEQTKWVLHSYGAGATKDANITIANTWNNLNGNNTFNAADKIYFGRNVFATGIADITSLDATDLASLTVVGTVTPMDEYRYRILPIAATNSATKWTIDADTTNSFADKISGFADAYLTIDLAKGPSYTDNVGTGKNVEDFMIGFARIDHTNKNNKVSGMFFCYPTDIVWVSFGDFMSNVPGSNSANTWDEAKATFSVKISDIFANGTHKKIHGTEEEQPTVTAENANAIVLGQKTKDLTFVSSQSILVYDDICIEKREEAPTETSFALTGSVAEGITLTATNAEESAITPIVITAYYSDNTLVAAVPNNELTIEAGATASKTYQVDASYDYDKVKVIVIDAYDTIKPLCVNFEG